MRKARKYDSYEDYVAFQKKKTTDPIRRAKWLGEEWELKLKAFESLFKAHPQIYRSGAKCLCLGARTGQEVLALMNIGIDATGIDLVPCPPYVDEGDIHDLKFENSQYDVVFSNVLDHALDIEKMMTEATRVVKVGGLLHFQIQVLMHQDEYTETYFDDPVRDISSVMPSNTFCLSAQTIPHNFAGMNYQLIFQKMREQI